MGVAETIVCVDCGGTCHRSPLGAPELGWRAGDVVTYRCRDCADLWHVELADEDLEAGDADARPPGLPDGPP